MKKVALLEIFDGFIAAIQVEMNIHFIKETENRYFADIPFEGERLQKVLVFLDEDSTGDSTVNYYSVICKINTDEVTTLLNALELNLSLDYGSIALMEEMLVIHQTYFVKDLDPERFIKSLFYVAAKANELQDLFRT